jgi:hypothetical protein
VGYELAGNAALFMGDYKIVYNRAPVGDGQWRLFNILKDPGEARELSAEMPQRLQTMLAHYQHFEAHNKVLPVAANYDARSQVLINGLQNRLAPALLVAMLTLLILIGFYATYRMMKKL